MSDAEKPPPRKIVATLEVMLVVEADQTGPLESIANAVLGDAVQRVADAVCVMVGVVNKVAKCEGRVIPILVSPTLETSDLTDADTARITAATVEIRKAAETEQRAVANAAFLHTEAGHA